MPKIFGRSLIIVKINDLADVGIRIALPEPFIAFRETEVVRGGFV